MKTNVLRSPLTWLLVIFAAGVVIGIGELTPDRGLPVIQPHELNPALVDPTLWSSEDHRILDFELVNHLGDSVTLENLEGEVLITDFFFSRCATICPIMTSNLRAIPEAMDGKTGWRILSHSVTPVADTPEVLTTYAKRMKAFHPNWWFLTGSKEEIYRLARTSYFACYDEAHGGDGGFQDFVHTENVVLVDAKGRLRGFYDGTSEEAIKQLIADAQFLLEENNEVFLE